MSRRRNRRGTVGGLALAAIVVVAVAFGIIDFDDLSGVFGEPSGGSGAEVRSSGGASGESALSKSEATSALGELRVASEGSMSGYSREDFPHWSDAREFGWDAPNDSCDTRDAALIRDGKNVQVGEGCDVESGDWVDPYAGEEISDPSSIDIDHIVPLANAWRSGADGWNQDRRESFANDPENILASDAGENRSKGDKGPEAWKPPDQGEWCDYAGRWIRSKSDYDLSVNSKEKSALAGMLDTCEAN